MIYWSVSVALSGRYRVMVAVERWPLRRCHRCRAACVVSVHPHPNANYHRRSNVSIWPNRIISLNNRSRRHSVLEQLCAMWKSESKINCNWIHITHKYSMAKSQNSHVPSGNLMWLNTSINESTATNGPRKHIGGGSSAQSAANAGGCGNVPPANGCSYGYGFDLGLYGIIWEKSGRGSWQTTSSLSIVEAFGVNSPVCCLLD